MKPNFDVEDIQEILRVIRQTRAVFWWRHALGLEPETEWNPAELSFLCQRDAETCSFKCTYKARHRRLLRIPARLLVLSLIWMTGPLLLSLLILCLSFDTALAVGGGHSNPCAQSNKNAFNNYVLRFYPDTNSLAFGSLTAWGGGGGNQQTIPSSSGGPFAGRQFGGADRKSIYGTRAYGSGYPYGATNISTIAGRPFPYGAWPISFGSYMGGQEVIGPSLDIMRPGGPLVAVQVGSTDTNKWNGLSPSEVYTMIGDRDTVLFMMGDLVNWCHATPQWPTMFNASNSTIKPENVIQYYRASSFALAYPSYNNSFARNNPSTSQTFAQSDPLPSNIATSAFLNCVNNTIGTAIPIVDSIDTSKPKKLSKGAIAGIVIGSVTGAALYTWFLWSRPPVARPNGPRR